MRFLLSTALLTVSTLTAAAQLPADTEAKIAALANKTLHDTGVPSASVGIAMNGKIVYTHAFGLANISPGLAASPPMAYPIGSISKQFTATAVLLLQQEGKLSIDDPVSKYFPELTRAQDVTLRNLMTMTSGYQDFAPQDYIIPAWRKPTDPLTTVHEWAEKPLDFEPGTDWQYSNTNYVLVALIVQKVTGEPFYQYLTEHVLTPLHLKDVFNTYTESEKLKITGYISNATAPPRVLPLEAPGWYFGDGDLAMPASTLLTWDLSILNQSLLSPASYKQFETSTILTGTKAGQNAGKDAHYGLGIFVRNFDGHTLFEHGGEVGGYVAENMVFPSENIAIVVLTNEVASSAASRIGRSIATLLLASSTPAASPADAAVAAFVPSLKTILTGLQTSHIDRPLFTADCNAYFNADTLTDFQSTLAPLGTITDIKPLDSALRGGMTHGSYKVTYSSGTVISMNVYLLPDGHIEQLLITSKN